MDIKYNGDFTVQKAEGPLISQYMNNYWDESVSHNNSTYWIWVPFKTPKRQCQCQLIQTATQDFTSISDLNLQLHCESFISKISELQQKKELNDASEVVEKVAMEIMCSVYVGIFTRNIESWENGYSLCDSFFGPFNMCSKCRMAYDDECAKIINPVMALLLTSLLTTKQNAIIDGNELKEESLKESVVVKNIKRKGLRKIVNHKVRKLSKCLGNCLIKVMELF